MKFQEAIISVINDYDKNILTKDSILNILSDYNAFQESKAFKVILKNIIADGYLDQIQYIKSWENSCTQLINRFVDNTGFQHDKASYVLGSLAYALGVSQKGMDYSKNISQQNLPSSQNGCNKPANVSQSSLNLTSSKLEKLNNDKLIQYKENAEQYLDSIIEIKGDSKKELGVDIIVASNYDPNDNSLTFRLEINGAIKRKIDYVYFNFVIYRNDGRIINTINAYCDKISKSYQVLETDYSFENEHKTIGNINKIVMYWDV